MSQHINNRIGNVVGEGKARMFQRLKANFDLRSAIALFMQEIRQEFAQILEEVESADAAIEVTERVIS